MKCRSLNKSAGTECAHCGKAQVIRLSFSDEVVQVFDTPQTKEQDIKTFEGTMKDLGILEREE